MIFVRRLNPHETVEKSFQQYRSATQALIRKHTVTTMWDLARMREVVRPTRIPKVKKDSNRATSRVIQEMMFCENLLAQGINITQ